VRQKEGRKEGKKERRKERREGGNKKKGKNLVSSYQA
jgi:hypothetical protein